MQKNKRRPLTTKKMNILSNLVLGTLVISLGALCGFSVEETTQTDGENALVYRSGNAELDGVSLMFNVYWGTEEVYSILQILEEHNATATFFIGGCWADDNVDCLREIQAKGHEIGNHGYFHKDHAKMNAEQNENEISSCNRFIELALGVTPTLFAPPSGAYDNATLTACQNLQMKTILWSKDTIDWRDKDEKLIYTRATKNVKSGDFILMHPMPKTVEALPNILSYYESVGLKTLTVSQNL